MKIVDLSFEYTHAFPNVVEQVIDDGLCENEEVGKQSYCSIFDRVSTIQPSECIWIKRGYNCYRRKSPKVEKKMFFTRKRVSSLMRVYKKRLKMHLKYYVLSELCKRIKR